MKLLLDAHAEPLARDARGATAADLARAKGHESVALLLAPVKGALV